MDLEIGPIPCLDNAFNFEFSRMTPKKPCLRLNAIYFLVGLTSISAPNMITPDFSREYSSLTSSATFQQIILIVNLISAYSFCEEIPFIRKL